MIFQVLMKSKLEVTPPLQCKIISKLTKKTPSIMLLEDRLTEDSLLQLVSAKKKPEKPLRRALKTRMNTALKRVKAWITRTGQMPLAKMQK
jgi:hypothetical protein